MDPNLHTIADTAVGLVYGDRQASYGHPDADFAAMGRITAAILTRWLDSEGLEVVEKNPHELLDRSRRFDYRPVPDIPPRIVALIQVAVKLSRESAQHKDDNLVDLIGYALCAQRIVDRDWETEGKEPE